MVHWIGSLLRAVRREGRGRGPGVTVIQLTDLRSARIYCLPLPNLFLSIKDHEDHVPTSVERKRVKEYKLKPVHPGSEYHQHQAN